MAGPKREKRVDKMHHQQYKYRFCPVCGGHLEDKNIKEQEPSRLVCEDCEFVFYLDPKLVVCSIVEVDEKVILLKRAIDPQKGKWVMPGGFVDRGEEIRKAALREAEEECGVKIKLKDLLGIYSYGGKTEVVVVYIAEHISGDLIVGDETDDAKLYSLDEIPWPELAFQSTVDALKDYCRRKNFNGKESERHL